MVKVWPDGTVKDEMTTLEQDERPDADDTELTVQVARLAVSVPEGIAEARRARAAARMMVFGAIMASESASAREVPGFNDESK